MLIGGVVTLPMITSPALLAIDIWNGHYPSSIIIGSIEITAPQFFLACGVGAFLGLGLMGAGIWMWRSVPKDR